MKDHFPAKMNLWLITIFITVIMFFLPSCDNPKPVKIGFVGGLTGKHYSLGVSGRNGVILAIEEINKKGGIEGRKVQLIIKDDMQDAKVLQKAIDELSQEDVIAIIGPMTSEMSLIAIPSVNEKKIVMISPTAASKRLAERDDYFIKLNSNISIFADSLANFASNNKRLKRASIAFDLNNRAYSEEFLISFKSAIQRKGGRVIAEIGYDTLGELSYIELSRKLLKNNPDYILLISNTYDTAMICQCIRRFNQQIPIFSSPWAMTEGIIPKGGRSVDGLIFGHTYNPEVEAPEFKAFKKRFKERFGKEPDFAAVKAFDATNMLSSTIPMARNSQVLKNLLIKQRKFKGITGDFEIDSFGDIEEKGFIIVINDGRFIKLE